jgi:hypothetical protein
LLIFVRKRIGKHHPAEAKIWRIEFKVSAWGIT